MSDINTAHSKETSTVAVEHAVKPGSTAQTDQIDSPLLRLPAEIRNMIYVYAIGGRSWSITMGDTKPWLVNMDDTKPIIDNAKSHALALLEVNRQVHSEAHLFPYIYNTFEGRHVGHLRMWIESLSDVRRNAITSLKHYKRSYIIESSGSVDVSPVFWMDNPNMTEWKVQGLKRIDIEIMITQWSWGCNHEKTQKAKAKALSKLRAQTESAHPGVLVNVYLRQGY